MAIIKKISVFNGSSWSDDNIGADASNISLNSSVTLNQVLLDKLTGGKVLVTNGSGIINASDIGTDKLGYLSGVTSDIQTQLDGKVSKTGDTITGEVTYNNAHCSLKSTNITRGEVGTQTAYGYSRIQFRDVNGDSIGQIRPVADTSFVGMTFATFKDGNNSNALTLAYDNNGNRTVRLGGAEKEWRTALNIQNTISMQTSSSTTSLSANTWKALLSITITPGIYIITAGCVFPTSVTSGTVAIHIGASSGTDGILTRSAQMNVPANAGNPTTNLSCVTLYNCTSSQTIYLNAYSATACTLATNASGLYAYKIIPN